jgi:uncharacterized membrane protein
MIAMYRGHILLGISVLFGLLGFASGYQVFYIGGVTGWWEFILLMTAMFSWIVCLLAFAFAYTMWVPKWERDERRTGRVPGDGKEDDEQDQRALAVETLD